MRAQDPSMRSSAPQAFHERHCSVGKLAQLDILTITKPF